MIHGYISLSGLNSFLIVQNFPNSAHPTIKHQSIFYIFFQNSPELELVSEEREPTYEDLVTCPYNKFHQIKKSRIQYHILQCKKVMVLVFSPNYEKALKLKDLNFLLKTS